MRPRGVSIESKPDERTISIETEGIERHKTVRPDLAKIMLDHILRYDDIAHVECRVNAPGNSCENYNINTVLHDQSLGGLSRRYFANASLHKYAG